MAEVDHVADLILNYNPEEPQARFKSAGVKGALLPNASDRLPSPVPWPSGHVPTPAPLNPAPLPTDDLSKFRGYDAVVVTWTSAEAATLAALFTPGYPTSAWYQYRHNLPAYIPLVTGADAPFNSTEAETARYYHSLGLYFPCLIGGARVLLFKSGLHLDYDGPATPVRTLMAEIAQAVQPKVFITTGTGGGIGREVVLGDVVIAGLVKFDCTAQFKTKPWHDAVSETTPVPSACLPLITPALTKINAARIPNARPTPKIWASSQDTIITTDFYGFDDSTNYYKLQGLGQVCDMGDAMVGMALQQFPNIQWFAIRNASDPQIPNPNHNIDEASKQASEIYSQYGALTTAASVIATWAVIDAIINKYWQSFLPDHPVHEKAIQTQ
jgi:hypothetical protein